MREIKFRYRLKDRITGKLRTEIYTLEEIEIDIFEWLERWEILSRDLWTGLADRQGRKIWEGDICRYADICSDAWMVHEEKTVGVVRWFDDRVGFQLQAVEENYRGGHYRESFDFCEEIEVIGDIYSNPELLADSKSNPRYE